MIAVLHISALCFVAAVLPASASAGDDGDRGAKILFARSFEDGRRVAVLGERVANRPGHGDPGAADPNLRTYSYTFEVISADGKGIEPVLRVFGRKYFFDERLTPFDVALSGDALVAVFKMGRNVSAQVARRAPDGSWACPSPGAESVLHDSTSGAISTVGGHVDGSPDRGSLMLTLEQWKDEKLIDPIHFRLTSPEGKKEWIPFLPPKGPASRPATAPIAR